MQRPEDWEVGNLLGFMRVYNIQGAVPGYHHLTREDLEAQVAEIKLRDAQAKEAEARDVQAREAAAREAAAKAAAPRRAVRSRKAPARKVVPRKASVPRAASPLASAASRPAPPVVSHPAVATSAVTPSAVTPPATAVPTPTSPLPGILSPATIRRKPPRLRAFFLRHFRIAGDVRLAAARTGIALSTLYRWRARDAAFRARWDELGERRRDMAEDRLMALVRDGERTAVFYKGEQVGWRQSHTARAAIAALAYFDRCDRTRERAPMGDRKELHESASRSGAARNDDMVDESKTCAERQPRKTGSAGSRPPAGQPSALPPPDQQQEGGHAEADDGRHAEMGELAAVGGAQAGEPEDQRPGDVGTRRVMEGLPDGCAVDGQRTPEEGHGGPAHQPVREPEAGQAADTRLRQQPACEQHRHDPGGDTPGPESADARSALMVSSSMPAARRMSVPGL